MADINIYIACPERTVTGGVELLHQLCHELDKYDGVNAYIWNPFNPYPITVPKVYADEYQNKTGRPQPGEVAIFPEIWAQYANNDKWRNVIYWESVDNAPKGLTFRDDTLHLAQSWYAVDYLHNGLQIPYDRVLYLTDYINDKFLEQYTEGKRNPIVLYNPAKGLNFTRKIMEYAPDLCFLPLTGMTTAEMIDVMRHSMVYIDFGNHPGKDRIPREAAMCGCCVLVGLNGSANYDDVDIDESYKFERSENQLPMICNRIRDIISNFNRHQDAFQFYRIDIAHEKYMFCDGVHTLVERLQS